MILYIFANPKQEHGKWGEQEEKKPLQASHQCLKCTRLAATIDPDFAKPFDPFDKFVSSRNLLA
ncbi:MAG: hypothetical protein ETSY2_09020 [Candidatus Entotheonella gemina]|uniref:Uncharacterized protein n=1 Tax=Candidatus Entotheonella gemina TaxID=1429439 RepID=W4MD34_9BACT|nr:MAG: hypothetical protein ETSY2_09020 [Candidatus Entotheonella gemina]